MKTGTLNKDLIEFVFFSVMRLLAFELALVQKLTTLRFITTKRAKHS